MKTTQYIGKEEFRPVKKFNIVIPNYFVSRDGRILSTKTKKHKILNPKYRDIKDKYGFYAAAWMVALRVDKTDPSLKVLFDEHEYNSSQQNANVPGSKYYKRLTRNPNLTSISLRYHVAVLTAWKPIDDYPPIPKEDWDKTPESAKQFIRDSAIIDHIDGDTTNNHIDNLRWSTQKENCHYRKKQAEERERARS